jgi:hypothetical protein
MRFRYSRHVEEEIKRRGIPSALFDSVLDTPQQVVVEKGGRKHISLNWISVRAESSC